jgi:type 1 fimbria pilin
MKSFFYFLFLVIGTLLINPLAYSSVYGIGAAGVGIECAPGYAGQLEDSSFLGCSWVQGSSGPEKARVMWGGGQVFSPLGSKLAGYVIGFEVGYPPFSAPFKMRMHFCPAVETGYCTLRASTFYLDSTASVYLQSGMLVTAQNPDFGGFTGVLSTSSTSCLTYLDSEMNEWKSLGDFFCRDATGLPEKPATCFLNHEQDLNVYMGEIERSEIQTSISSSNHHVKKEFKVLCTRDAGTSAIIQFEYETISVDGGDAIFSSADGVGIAMMFDGEVVGRNKTFSRNYDAGYSTESLDFYVVRDNLYPISDIPSGDFTANAVMVLTIQ